MFLDDFIEFRPIAGHPLVRKIICRFFHPNPHGKVVNYTYHCSETEHGIHTVLGNDIIKLG